MIFLAPQLPHSQIDAALAAAPVVRSFSPDTGGKAQVAAGTTITLPPQSSRFALWLRTTAAARVLAAGFEYDDAPIPAGGVGVQNWQDIPQGGRLVQDGQPIMFTATAPTGFSFLQPPTSPTMEEIRAGGLFYQLATFDYNFRVYCFCLREKAGVAGQLQMNITAISGGTEDNNARLTAMRFPAVADLPLTWGGASVPNNAPLHRAEGAMLGIFPANATFTLTFEDDAEIRNLVYSEIIGELRDYPRVRGVMDRRERTSMGLTGLVHVRRLSDARLNCSLELSNHNEEDARLLEHLAALDGFGVVPNGGRSNAEGATWARANVCRFVRARGYSGFVGWGDVNDLGATGKVVLSEVPEFVGEVAPYVPPQRGDYLLLPDGFDKLILADGDGALLLAAA